MSKVTRLPSSAHGGTPHSQTKAARMAFQRVRLQFRPLDTKTGRGRGRSFGGGERCDDTPGLQEETGLPRKVSGGEGGTTQDRIEAARPQPLHPLFGHHHVPRGTLAGYRPQETRLLPPGFDQGDARGRARYGDGHAGETAAATNIRNFRGSWQALHQRDNRKGVQQMSPQELPALLCRHQVRAEIPALEMVQVSPETLDLLGIEPKAMAGRCLLQPGDLGVG